MSGSVDLSKIKPGDEVLVRFRVNLAQSGGDWPHIEIDPSGQLDGGVTSDRYLSFGVGAIVSHTPKALAVGDLVKRFNDAGRIEAVCGDHAWVLYDGVGGPVTELLTDLERA